ncbi:unnamed protein product, partial [Prorocentrum cordatum]
MAVMEFGATPKQLATLLAAVARGAACGIPAQAAGAGSWVLEVVQEAVDLVKEGLGGDRTARSANEKLRAQGPEGDALARRIGRATKACNWSSHPDARFRVRDVANAQGNSDPSEKADLSTDLAGLSERTGLSGAADEGEAESEGVVNHTTVKKEKGKALNKESQGYGKVNEDEKVAVEASGTIGHVKAIIQDKEKFSGVDATIAKLLADCQKTAQEKGVDLLFWGQAQPEFGDLLGQCQSTNCRYAHSPSELRHQPNLHKTRMCRAFLEDAKKTITRFASYGCDLEKYDSMAAWVKNHGVKVRGFPGVKHVEIAVCGTGRMGVFTEYNDLASFKEYMDSDLYKKLAEDLKNQDWYDASKEPQSFVGFKQPNLCVPARWDASALGRVCQDGNCPNAGSCSFAHSESELRVTDGIYKTQMCHFFERGRCLKGDRCNHAHGPDDLRRSLAAAAAASSTSGPELVTDDQRAVGAAAAGARAGPREGRGPGSPLPLAELLADSPGGRSAPSRAAGARLSLDDALGPVTPWCNEDSQTGGGFDPCALDPGMGMVGYPLVPPFGAGFCSHWLAASPGVLEAAAM